MHAVTFFLYTLLNKSLRGRTAAGARGIGRRIRTAPPSGSPAAAAAAAAAAAPADGAAVAAASPAGGPRGHRSKKNPETTHS